MRTLKKQKENTRMMVLMALLGAIVVVLQFFAGSISIGSFSITLALVPIVLGAVLYGPIQGAILGGLFGIVVSYSVVTGTDVGGHIMFEYLPAVTLFMCIFKGAVAGFMAGFVAKCLKEYDSFVRVVAAAIVAPICNTAILSLGIVVFYRELASQWAVAGGFDSIIAYIIFGMCGLNFVLELSINIIFAPVISTVIKATKRFLK
ncbi:MAG: ECF transporter S component [Ruminococcaceae bacterium]|nr:ECF transporter S component [Oscillospiraceae bacterium]